MAHEIDMTTGKAAAMIVGAPAWHRLGTVVSTAQTSADAIKLAGLDWDVEQWPLHGRRWNDADLEEVEVASHFANVRSDTRAVLGVVGKDYTVFQNRAAFEFMDSIVQEKLAIWETAGALKGGRQVWMMCRLPGDVRPVKDDEIIPYVLLTTAHDGSRAFRIFPTTVRVVCQNTLNLAMGRDAHRGLAIAHNGTLEARVAEARDVLGVVNRRMEQFAEQTQAMARKSMTRSQLSDYFSGLLIGRSEVQQKKMLGQFLENLTHPTNEVAGIGGTLWSAYNAVSYFADHQLGSKDAGVGKLEGRLNSIWFGAANQLKQLAFDDAIALAV